MLNGEGGVPTSFYILIFLALFQLFIGPGRHTDVTFYVESGKKIIFAIYGLMGFQTCFLE